MAAKGTRTLDSVSGVAVIAAVCLFLPSAASAQRTNAYVAVGAGAAEVAVGGEWLVSDSRVGVGGEVGTGLTLTGSLTGYLHVGPSSQGTIDPFLLVSFTGMGASGYDAQGLSAGVGLTYWLSRRVGLRADTFKFWPVINEEGSVEDREEVGARHFGLRGGISIGF